MYRRKLSDSSDEVFNEIESDLNNIVENLSNIESSSKDIDEVFGSINDEIENLKEIVKKLY